jgi:hypothetical protein
MKTHRVIAQPWQLNAAADVGLEVIILPLVPQPKKHQPKHAEAFWLWNGCKSDIRWQDGETANDVRMLMALQYQPCDRLYLAEEWAKEDQLYISRSEDPNDDELWFGDAEYMPPEAAQYWFEVTEVKVTQAKYLDYFTIGKTGFYNSYPESTYPSEEFKNDWDKAHPEHSWSGANWVIVLEVRIVNQ